MPPSKPEEADRLPTIFWALHGLLCLGAIAAFVGFLSRHSTVNLSGWIIYALANVLVLWCGLSKLGDSKCAHDYCSSWLGSGGCSLAIGIPIGLLFSFLILVDAIPPRFSRLVFVQALAFVPVASQLYWIHRLGWAISKPVKKEQDSPEACRTIVGNIRTEKQGDPEWNGPNLFSKGQKIYLLYSKDDRAFVRGRHRRKHGYLEAWVSIKHTENWRIRTEYLHVKTPAFTGTDEELKKELDWIRQFVLPEKTKEFDSDSAGEG